MNLSGILNSSLIKALSRPNAPENQTLIKSIRNSPAMSGTEKNAFPEKNVPLPEVGLASAEQAFPSVQDLGPAKQDARLSEYTSGSTPKGQEFDIQGVDEQKPKSDWKKQLVMALGGGIQGYLDTALPYGGRHSGGIIGGLADKYKKEQMDALEQRQHMWGEAYGASTKLPGEILTDPRFSSLAKAKMALDKDMADGKIDNEKNVGNFYTELARHSKGLTSLGIDQSVGAQKEMFNAQQAAGLSPTGEQLTDMEVPGLGKQRVPQSIAIPQAFRADAANKGIVQRAAAIAAGNASREKMNTDRINAGTVAQGKTAKTHATEHAGNVSRNVMSQAIRQIQAQGEITDPREQRAAAAQLVGEYHMQQADADGLIDEDESGYTFQGRSFPQTEEGVSALHEALATYYGSK